MEFEPFNRFLLVEKVETVNPKQDRTKSAILVPDEYVIQELHGLYKVLKVSEDCEKLDEGAVGKTIIVNSSMVEEVKASNQTYSLILENYIYGIFNNI